MFTIFVISNVKPLSEYLHAIHVNIKTFGSQLKIAVNHVQFGKLKYYMVLFLDPFFYKSTSQHLAGAKLQLYFNLI